MTSDERRRIYFVTGANSGVGLEATRQLLAADENCHVYMLCRSQERAEAAKETLGDNPKSRALFLSFDAYSVGEDFAIPDDVYVIDGLLLNAGGFGDDPKFQIKNTATTDDQTAGATTTTKTVNPMAQLNLLGHAALVKKLLAANKLTSTSRIVAAGSEGCFAPPAPNFHWDRCDFAKHLTGEINETGPGGSYARMKGIVALYWAAFARHHPELFVVTVSPGAIKGTGLFTHAGASGTLRMVGKGLIFFMGSHTVQDGAQRYLDALLRRGMFEAKDAAGGPKEVASGTFLAHRKGYTKDFGDVSQHKAGQAFADTTIQDRVWVAVEAML